MQNENTPAEGQNSDKLEAESALRDAACCASSIPFGTDLSHVAEENSKAADELLATGQFLVDVGKNLVPFESLEKGVPVRWANPIPTASSEPDRDNGSSESCVVSLQFWGMWVWMKARGLQNWEWREVRSMPHELKAEVVRMWKAPTLPDDEIF